MESPAKPFECAGETVAPGERVHLRYEISETYLSDSVTVPVTLVHGRNPGPVVFLTAALHGDELNGVEVVRRVADEFGQGNLHGTLVCIHVANVPGFNAQERYIPLDDSDLNRSFPGDSTGTAAERIAAALYETFIRRCDFGIDFHTSTRGRTNLVHVRADLHSGVDRLALSFAANVVFDERGPLGSLRRVATEDGIPTITVEMGEAKRFQRDPIETGVAGVKSVFAEFGLHPQRDVHWPGWRVIIGNTDKKRWIRADDGGIVEMTAESGSVVEEGDRLCRITNPFNETRIVVTAPFTGLVVGVLENPVVYPGNPICHLVGVGEDTRRAIEGSRRP
ncbi:succinylglutamate desuccinylase/aspartoacylase family protein [Haloarchaeobius sp. TZWWS8]|uniref:succinylglutamate desuccinylase/aspartoacylase family protein n=1 Tax=Haloarchaeobius sp. TZWWS8 TaxID=3446121 RepID=UPI003EB9D201